MNNRKTRMVVAALFLGLALLPGRPAVANEPTALNDYALELLSRGEYDKALEQLQRAYSLNSYDTTIRKNLAEAYTYVGKRRMDRNQFDEAATFFDNARELFPDNSRYATLRGIALYFAKRYDAAAFELERSRQLGGDTVEVLYFLGRVRYDTENLAGALEAWDKALAIDPNNKAVRDMADKARREAAVESRMDKGYSSRFSISYDTEVKSNLADSILDTLESAYNRVGSDLDHFPTARIPVILYTKKDYRTVTASPDWSGGLYDGKIRLPIGGASELGEQLRAVLVHEYTHVVVRDIANGNCPMWLNEGLAEVEGRREYNPPLQEIKKAFAGGTLLSFATLEGPFTGLSGKRAQLAYEESYSIVNFMAATYGWYKIKEILVNLGSGMPVAAAVAKALGDFGLDYEQVEREWREYLARELAGG